MTNHGYGFRLCHHRHFDSFKESTIYIKNGPKTVHFGPTTNFCYYSNLQDNNNITENLDNEPTTQQKLAVSPQLLNHQIKKIFMAFFLR